MALSQMGGSCNTSGSDGVYRRSADSGIAEVDATRRLSWTDTFTVQLGLGGYRGVGPLSARSEHYLYNAVLINEEQAICGEH